MSDRKYQDGDIELCSNDSLICPYCGKEQKDIFESVSYEDGHEGMFTCGSCSKDFGYTTNVSTTFTTYIDDPYA